MLEQESIKPDADVIGIVFPVYNSMNDGLPLILIRFAEKLENITSKYIFAVCNSGGGIFPGSETLSGRITSRGGKLSAFFSLKMPFNVSPVPDAEKQKMIIQQSEKKLAMICETVRQKKVVPYGFPFVLKVLFMPLGALMRKLYISKMQKQIGSVTAKTLYELTPLIDNTFSVDSKCNGCGICSNICPVKNIEIIDNRPSWQHHCETCLACFHWCPSEAIACSSSEVRYHNPKIELSDLLNQRLST